jgi:dienelactone hydrolase
VAGALALGGCASVPPATVPATVPDAAAAIVAAPIEIEGQAYAAHWYLPAGEASALIVLQHGFTRRCSHLRETTRRLMAGGLMALCLDAPMAGGNPGLAGLLARRLADALVAPDGRALPAPIIVGGHSAGAAFAARLGAQLDALAPQRLAGALLFDPVATAGFEAALRRISDAGRRPVLALFANAQGCNAQLSAAPALRRVRQDALEAGREGFVGVQLTDASSHADVEGEDTDWIAVAVCGAPLPANVALVRALAVQWAQDIARGVPPSLAAGSGWRLIE